MQLHHRFSVAAPIDVAWAAFNELEKVAPCFPGAELTSVDGDEFSGTCKVKLGPISLQYTGTGRFLERDDAAHRAVIEARGRDKRGNGTAGASVTAQLSPDGVATHVEVTTELSITGKPAQFGRGVMQDVSDRLLAQFVDCLQERLAPQAAALPPGTPDAVDTQEIRADEEAQQLDVLGALAPAMLKRFAAALIALFAVAVVVVRWLRR